jgi:hypothetical protein
MWLFTTKGFFSIVNKVDHDNLNHPYQVRARRLDELQELAASVPCLAGKEIKTYDFADYAYRIFLNEAEAKEVGGYLLTSINYDNFKNQFEGKPKWYEFKKILGQIWGVMYEYQETAELGKRKRYHQWGQVEEQPRHRRNRGRGNVSAADLYDGRL